MLRFDGYYVEEPSEIYDRRVVNGDVSFIFLAYRFLDNSKLYWTTQHAREDELLDFSINDFEIPRGVEEKWRQKEEEIVIEKSAEYTKEIILRKDFESRLFNLHSQKYLHFVPWNKVESDSGVLKSIFRPFEKGKYQRIYT